MNNKEMKLEREVMQRVKAIHHMRTVTRPFFVELGLFVVSLVSIGFLVSIPHVVSNTLHSGGVLSYILKSFVHTSAIVQIVFALGLATFILLAREIAKNFVPHLTRVV